MSRNAALPPHLERVVRGLLGQPCWRVQMQDTSVMLDFGEPRLEFLEAESARRRPVPPRRGGARAAPRNAWLGGAWLWRTLHCEWRLRSDGERTSGWHAPRFHRAAPRRARRAAAEAGERLLGRALVRVELEPRRARCRFTFEGRAVLEIRPWRRPELSDDWLIRDPSNHWYAYRCRGEWCREPEWQGEYQWHPLPSRRGAIVFAHRGPVRYPIRAILGRVSRGYVQRITPRNRHREVDLGGPTGAEAW